MNIRIGAVDLAAGGVHRNGQVLEVVAFTGEAVPLVHVVAESSGGSFIVDRTGALEWGTVFRVTATPDGSADLCR